jgi:hypothetical protein
METKAFWWGRGFGCEFLEKSCFELAKKSRKWPFCGEEEYYFGVLKIFIQKY